ncbi:uncharacterized protein LOC131881146 isoform X2 [Tigriopus californicus]|uniref:uncharacterized protein LOC131881146 isoform X2 n=1 Tax=Tigriopus californicus TaxID=6832 RepID=UPI0027DA12AC|nr:uncharacterized protein LOC131881146 isoform X2 [Tigriopus californicus]
MYAYPGSVRVVGLARTLRLQRGLRQFSGSSPPALHGLTYALPDLQPLEVQYVTDQVRLLGQSHLIESGDGQLVWQDSPLDTTQRVRRYYPHFLAHVPVYSLNIKSKLARPIYLERLACGFRSVGVSESVVHDTPNVFLSAGLPQLARHALLSQQFGCVMAFLSRKILTREVRTKVLRQWWTDLERTLVALELSLDVRPVTGQCQALFDQCQSGGVTLGQFQKTAIRGVLSELCARGTPDVRRSAALFTPGQITKKDAVSVVRNFYWLVSVLGVDVFSSPERFKCVIRLCPLETLVFMNAYYEQLVQLDPSLTPLDGLNYFRTAGLNLILRPSYDFPPLARVRLLRDMGFTSDQIRDILLSKPARFSDTATYDPNGHRFHFSSPYYVSEFRRRLAILNEDENLAKCTSPLKKLHAMSHWRGFLETIRSVSQGRKESVILALASDNPVDSVVPAQWWTPAGKLKRKEGVVEFLATFLEQDPIQVGRDVEGLFSHVSALTLNEGIQKLTELEFSHEQIRNAVHILGYPHKLIVDTLARMEKDMPEHFPDWSQSRAEPYILQACLYFIEKDNGFIPAAQLYSAERQGPEFSAPILDECSRILDHPNPNRSTLLQKRPIDLPTSELRGKSAFIPVRDPELMESPWTPMQNQIRHFSSSNQLSSNFEEKLGDLVNQTLYVNPLKVLQISTEFQKLKEWDPLLEKSTFVEATKQVRPQIRPFPWCRNT